MSPSPRRRPFIPTILAVGLVFASLSAAGAERAPAKADAAERYLVVFDQDAVSSAVAADTLRAAGGSVVRDLPELGVAVVESAAPDFAGRLRQRSEIVAVGRDSQRSFFRRTGAAGGDHLVLPSDRGGEAPVSSFSAPTSAPLVTPEQLPQAPFYPFQWSLRKTEVDQAWALGHVGDPAVTVAILASGIDYTHPELAGRVDLGRSVNLRPDDAALVQQLFPGAHPIADLGLHGSYIASIIACNAFGQACYAPNVTLVGVKILDKDERGSVGDLVAGLDYAAGIRADIVVVPETQGLFDLRDADDRAAIFAMARAILRAKLRGSLVLAPAWTTVPLTPGENADHNGTLLHMPAEAGATVVGGTGTEDQWSGTNDYGFTLIDVAAPGGQIDPETNAPPPNINIFQVGVCSSFTQYTQFFPFPDICNKNVPPQYIFSFGARMAVAEAAGTAALIDSRWGGGLHGFLLRAKLLGTADDILDPGRDPFSGRGRINARRAVTE